MARAGGIPAVVGIGNALETLNKEIWLLGMVIMGRYWLRSGCIRSISSAYEKRTSQSSCLVVPVVKHRIRQLTLKQAQEWAEHILTLRTASDIKKNLEEIAKKFEI